MYKEAGNLCMRGVDLTFQPFPDPRFPRAWANDTGLARLKASFTAVTATGSSIVQRCSLLALVLISLLSLLKIERRAACRESHILILLFLTAEAGEDPLDVVPPPLPDFVAGLAWPWALKKCCCPL